MPPRSIPSAEPLPDGILVHRLETAGKLASRRVPTTRAGETVEALRQRIAQHAWDLVDPILAVDDHGHYLGVVRIRDILDGDGSRPVGTLVDRSWPAVPASLDQEHVAEIARAGALTGVPVVAGDGRVIGAVAATRLLDVLAREHTEDLNRLAGILKPLDAARHALDDPPWRRALDRLPWLLVGLAGSAAATGIMAASEATFAHNLKVAFFVPAIVYLADAIGTQTEAVAVRGLTHSRRAFLSLMLGEVLTGGLIGLVLAVIAVIGVAVAFGDVRLALAVAIAILAAGTLACGIGLTLPWLLQRAGLDPAFGSGPLATILQDVLSILIYVAAVAAIVP